MQPDEATQVPAATGRRFPDPGLFAGLIAVLGAAVLAVYFVSAADLVDTSGQRVGRDFLNLHVAGTLIGEGRVAALFDGAAYLAALREIVGDPDYPDHNWSYPPLVFPLAQAVAALPYALALALWHAAGIAAVVAAARVLGLCATWGAVVAFSPAGVLAIYTGQNGLFAAALVAVAVHLGQAGRPVAAGLAWAVLAAKPHLGLVVLPMLGVQRRPGVILAGGVFLALGIGATLALYGPEPWQRFLADTAPQQRAVVERGEGLLLWLMPSFFIQGRLWGLGLSGAYALHALGALLALVLLARSLPERRGTGRGTGRDWLTWLVLGTFLLLPYSFFYDVVVYQLVLALWHRTPGRLFAMAEGKAACYLWALAWLMPVVGIASAAYLGLQPMPFFLMVLLWRRAIAGRQVPAPAD